MLRPGSLAPFLALLLLSIGCGPSPTPSATLPPTEVRAAEWDTWRTAKDSLFRTAASPLPAEDLQAFDGLDYFAYDSTLAFALPLDPALQRDTLRLATSTGEPRDYIRFGILSFPLDGRQHRLTVFQAVTPAPGEDPALDLFVPFADATNGRATYAAGRYLDFEPTTDGRYVLDFNYAYSPYCAYNPQYSCPLPPPENRLNVAIPAGERAGDLPAGP